MSTDELDDERIVNAVRRAYTDAEQRAGGLPFNVCDVDVVATDPRLPLARVRAFFAERAGEDFLVKADADGDLCISAFSRPDEWGGADFNRPGDGRVI